jgi:hypothetical protein
MSPQLADGITNIDICDLRSAIRLNRISFPVPVPVFASQHRPDVQWRLAELYFIHGWSPVKLAERYGVSSRRVRQSLHNWASRARMRGYLQPVCDSGEVQDFISDS